MKLQDNPRILVVEDEPEMARVLKQLLEVRSSAEVETAATLAGAREKLASNPFDLVTLDYRLPDGFGFELLTEITSSKEHPPVIIVTGRGDEELASLSFSKGAAGYIVKNDRLAVSLPQAVKKALTDFVLVRAVEAVRESESFYRTLFEKSSDSLFIVTAGGEMEDVNEAAAEMLGYSRDEIIGRPAGDFVPPARRAELAEALPSLFAGGAMEFENVRKDGTTIPVEVTARRVNIRRGPRYIVSARDITERKQALKALENERTFFEDALDAMPDVFVIADLDGTFYEWNRRFREVTGYTFEELESMSALQFLRPEDYGKVTAVISSIARTGAPLTVAVDLITRDGRAIPYEFTGSQIRDSEGRPLGVAGIGHDLTERNRSEDALRKVIKETNERREEITALLQSTRLVLERREFKAAMQEIFGLCHRLVGSSIGFMTLFEEEGPGKLLFFKSGSAVADTAQAVEMPADKLKTPVFMSGKAFYENNFADSELAGLLPGEPDHPRIDNLLVAPLLVKKTPAGALGFANKPGGFTGRDTLMASAFGEVASVALSESITRQRLEDSEGRFRSVAETAMEAIICADKRANIIFWNPSAEKMFGYSEEEVLGRQATLILPEREREARLAMMLRQEGIEKEKSVTFELDGLRKDGSEFPMECSYSSWSVGGKVNFAIIVRDITGRKKAEEKLRESEDLHRSLFTLSPDAVTVFSLDGRVIAASRRAIELYGRYEPDEIKPLTALDFVEEQDRQRAAEALAEILEGKSVRCQEFGLLNGEGARLVGEVSAAPLRDKHGKPAGFVTVTRDVTERKRAERELQTLNKELEGYAHLVSHDLKGPLSSINAAGVAMRSLLRGELSDQVIESVMELSRIIESNAMKSSKLTDDLLELAEAGHKPWEVSEVEVEGVVQGVLDEHSEEIREKQVRVRRDDYLGAVRANPTHIYLLFSNLISNAIRHNDNPNPEITIEYLPQAEKGRHRYRIRDNGPGVDPEHIEKIFLPFFSSVTGRPGIGLATVHKIVNIYHGEVRAFNEGGACFDFTINDYG